MPPFNVFSRVRWCRVMYIIIYIYIYMCMVTDVEYMHSRKQLLRWQVTGTVVARRYYLKPIQLKRGLHFGHLFDPKVDRNQQRPKNVCTGKPSRIKFYFRPLPEWPNMGPTQSIPHVLKGPPKTISVTLGSFLASFGDTFQDFWFQAHWAHVWTHCEITSSLLLDPTAATCGVKKRCYL